MLFMFTDPEGTYLKSEIPIVRFQNEGDRVLDAGKRLELSRSIIREVSRLENDAGPGRSRENEEHMSTVLSQLVLEYARDNQDGFRNILRCAPFDPWSADHRPNGEEPPGKETTVSWRT